DLRPIALVLRQGGTVGLSVYTLRRHGFADPIRLEAVGLPAGVTAPPIVVGPGQNEATLVLKAEPTAADFAGPITLQGTSLPPAPPAGQPAAVPLVRAARSATIVWPVGANQPVASRLSRGLFLAVRPAAPYFLGVAPTEVAVGQGSLVTLDLKLERRNPDFVAALTGVTALPPLPPNLPAPAAVNIAEKTVDGQLFVSVPANVAPGVYSLVLQGTGQVPFTKTPMDPMAKKDPIATATPSLPITLTVAARPVEVKADPTAPAVKAGAKVDVKVTVTRQGDFKGPVTLTLTLPATVKGVTAAPVTVAPEAKEGVVSIQAAADATVANHGNVTIRATADVAGVKVTVDDVVTLNITK
ncbi:MAG: hypothetical protein ACRDD1_19865, partial [Planctomycetia bacterium]